MPALQRQGLASQLVRHPLNWKQLGQITRDLWKEGLMALVIPYLIFSLLFELWWCLVCYNYWCFYNLFAIRLILPFFCLNFNDWWWWVSVAFVLSVTQLWTLLPVCISAEASWAEMNTAFQEKSDLHNIGLLLVAFSTPFNVLTLLLGPCTG